MPGTLPDQDVIAGIKRKAITRRLIQVADFLSLSPHVLDAVQELETLTPEMSAEQRNTWRSLKESLVELGILEGEKIKRQRQCVLPGVKLKPGAQAML